MQAPVFRELYSEKRVVLEERRMRVDDSPMGRFQEGFAGEALTNNYRRPVIGYPADLALLGRHEVQSFFNKHYGPQRLCISVVGDVQVEQVSRLPNEFIFPARSCECIKRDVVGGVYELRYFDSSQFCDWQVLRHVFVSKPGTEVTVICLQ